MIEGLLGAAVAIGAYEILRYWHARPQPITQVLPHRDDEKLCAECRRTLTIWHTDADGVVRCTEHHFDPMRFLRRA